MHPVFGARPIWRNLSNLPVFKSCLPLAQVFSETVLPSNLLVWPIFFPFLFAPTQNIADHFVLTLSKDELAKDELAWPLTRPLIGRFESVLQWERSSDGMLGKARPGARGPLGWGRTDSRRPPPPDTRLPLPANTAKTAARGAGGSEREGRLYLAELGTGSGAGRVWHLVEWRGHHVTLTIQRRGQTAPCIHDVSMVDRQTYHQSYAT